MPKHKPPQPRHQPQHRGKVGGVHKPEQRAPSKLGLALQAKKSSSTAQSAAIAFAMHHSAVSSGGKEDAFDEELVSLICECLREAPDAKLPLSALGAAVRELGRRRGLRNGDDSKLQSLSQLVSARWGGWEGLARATPGLRCVDGGVALQLSSEPPLHGSADAGLVAQNAHMLVGSTAAYPDARQSAVPSKQEIEGLSLASL